jgi:NAD(P)-dependent dehydrogenase (short-subunit alcohol dehydrogenase family)
MKIQDATILVTGANRGLGLAFARAALERGARKIYAGARAPGQVKLPGVTPVQLDVLDEESVAAAARLCGDVNLLINNSGIAGLAGVLGADSTASMRQHLELTNA